MLARRDRARSGAGFFLAGSGFAERVVQCDVNVAAHDPQLFALPPPILPTAPGLRLACRIGGPNLTAHGPLWDALRKKGRQVRVIGIAVENETVDRAARVLRLWAATAPGKPSEGRTLQQEIKRIDTALRTNNETVLAEYGGFNAAMKKGAELESLPQAKVTEGVSIDDYSTWRATRFADSDEIG